MTEKEYREHPAISRSELWKLMESPQKFKWEKEHPETPTPALIFGQAFHKLVLQPEMGANNQMTVTSEFCNEILDKFADIYPNVRLIPQVHKFIDVR